MPKIRPNEVNLYLGFAGISELNNTQILKLIKEQPAEKLSSALKNAKSNEGARNYLVKAIRSLEKCAQDLGAGSEQQFPSSREEATAYYPFLSQGVHVYGEYGALYIEKCVQQKEGRKQLHTLYIETAKALPKNKYRWENKRKMVLTEKELPMLLAVCLGVRQKLSGYRDGGGASKPFSFTFQEKHVFFELNAAQHLIRVQIRPGELFYIITLLVCQIRANQPWLTQHEIFEVLAHLPNE